MSVAETAFGVFIWLALIFVAISMARQHHPRQAISVSGLGGSFRLQVAFLLLVLAALLLWRSPFLFFQRQLNPDEGQFLTQALTYQRDWVPWRSADGGTAGPLDSYVLTWPYLFGLKLTYTTGRLTGLACIFITIYSYFKTASKIVGPKFSALAVLPLVAFFVFAFQSDFTHFSSEHLPMALQAIAVYLLVKIYRRPAWNDALILGIIAGAVPFTKIQAAPLGVYLFLVGMVLLLFREGLRPRYAKIKGPTLALLAGGLVMPGLILIPVFITGTGEGFINYLVGGLNYNRSTILGNNAKPVVSAMTDGGNVSESQTQALHLWKPLLVIGHGGEATIYLITLGFLIGVGLVLILAKARLPASRRWLAGLALILGYVLLAFYVIQRPGTRFHHYLLLSLGPVLLLFLWILRGYLKSLSSSAPRFLPLPRAILYVVLVIAPSLAWREIDPFTEGTSRPLYQWPPENTDEVIQYLNSQAHRGDSLVVWGWVSPYFVDTQLPSGTRQLVGSAYLLPGKIGDHERDIYLRDMERSRPRFFIDAVGVYYWASWPQPIERCRHTAYPVIADYIAKNYYLAKTVQPGLPPSCGDIPILIYVRRD